MIQLRTIGRWLMLVIAVLVLVLCAAKVYGADDTRTMVATAYCTCPKCCGPAAHGVCADGTPAKGKIIAAPKSIPFGTVLSVPGYGTAIVHDRGGAIKGNRLDLLFASHKAARQWGRREVVVTFRR